MTLFYAVACICYVSLGYQWRHGSEQSCQRFVRGCPSAAFTSTGLHPTTPNLKPVHFFTCLNCATLPFHIGLWICRVWCSGSGFNCHFHSFNFASWFSQVQLRGAKDPKLLSINRLRKWASRGERSGHGDCGSRSLRRLLHDGRQRSLFWCRACRHHPGSLRISEG